MALTSNSTRGQRKRKLDEIHEDLKYDLAFKHLESPKKFRGAAKKYLSHADWSSHTEAFDIMDRLEANGQLAPGQYGVLRQIGHKITESKFVEAIDEAEKEIVKSEVKEDDSQLLYSSNEKINNIITQTKREIDVHLTDRSYVHLPVVNHGLKVLQQSGLLVLVGRSGSGKTKCALQILSQASQARVLKLQRLHEWSEMVEMTVENWVWYDDVFEHDMIDKNRSMIATIKVCVQDGSSKVIFTVTDEVYEQNKPSFQKFVPSESFVNFEEPQHSLCVKMKYKILMSHLKVNGVNIKNIARPVSPIRNSNDIEGKLEITESDIDEIILKKPLLGFPQACYVFCSHVSFLKKGHQFFDNPSRELLNTLIEMSSSENDKFITLVYTFQKGGQLDFKNIDESRISGLLQTFSKNVPHDIEAFIRGTVIGMNRKYLIRMPEDVYNFTHSSIYKAVAISYATYSSRTKIEAVSLLSNTCINETIKPAGHDMMDHCVIEVGKQLYSELADIISMRLKRCDFSLFKCDIFSDEEFINIFAPKYHIPLENVHEHLRHFFRYGRMHLAQRTLVSSGLTIECLDERKYLQILKETVIHNQSAGVNFLINEKRNTHQKTNAIIECMAYIRQTDDASSNLIKSLSLAELDKEQLQIVSTVLTRDDRLDYFVNFINKLPDEHHDQTLEIIAKTIGRRNAKTCLNAFLNKFQSKREAIILYVMEGACASGHNDLLALAIEHHQELTKTHAAHLLQHVEIPSSLELLLGKYGCDLKPQDYSEVLNSLCVKGKSLCVKVLIDNWPNSTDSDIENALRSALKEEHFGIVNVLSESLSIPHDMITEIIATLKGNGETRSNSAYPSTNTPRPPSVLSRKNFTPCIYEDTFRRTNRKLCVMRCLSKQYLSTETNVYSRAYRLSILVHDNNISHVDKLDQCQAILAEKPTICEDLIIESAVHSCFNEKLLFMFLVKYPSIWKNIFSSCRNDSKQCQSLLINLQKIWKKTGHQFLPAIVDFLVRNEENISTFITTLTATECIVDIEEFISALESHIEPHPEIAEILLRNFEELTSHTSTIAPLKLLCKRNRIDVFEFIWRRSGNQMDIIFAFLSKDIVDENGDVIYEMLYDREKKYEPGCKVKPRESDMYASDINIAEIFVKCLQYRSSRWLSTLNVLYRRLLLDSLDLILFEINKDSDTSSLDLMFQILSLEQWEMSEILYKACKNRSKFVLQGILKADLNDGTFVRSIQNLSRKGHHDIVLCFEELFKTTKLTKLECDFIVDTIVSCCNGADNIITLLRRMALMPCLAGHVFSLKMISVIGIDFFMTKLSVILSHLDGFLPYRITSDIRSLVSILTVSQQNQIIEIIVENALTNSIFSILAVFLKNCKEVVPRIGKLLIEKVFPVEGKEVGTYCDYILLYIFENFPSHVKNNILLKYFTIVVTGSFGFDIQVKISMFELVRKRALDIYNTVIQYFYEVCKRKNRHDNEEEFIQHLIDTDFLDNSDRTKGIKLCLLKYGVCNQEIARMILNKDKLSLPIDKSKIFETVCKCKIYRLELVECVLELYSNHIDYLSLKVGFRYLLNNNIFGYNCIRSKIIVDKLVGMKVNIDGNARSLFDKICEKYDDGLSLKLLKYIINRYADLIKENVVEGFNKASVRLNALVAIEICKAFRSRIALSEYILLWFLDDWQLDKKSEIFIEFSKSLDVNYEICMRFANGEIPEYERWKTLSSMFSSSITADMKWKLLCLWLDKYKNFFQSPPYWLSDADIELTNEHVTYLKQNYPSYRVAEILRICKVHILDFK